MLAVNTALGKCVLLDWLDRLNHPRGARRWLNPQLNLWANGAPPPDTTGLDRVNSSANFGEWAAVSCDTSAVVVQRGHNQR